MSAADPGPATARDDVVIPLPPSLPRSAPNPFARWLARSILRAGGWRMVGAFPDVPKAVLLGAPHSSKADGSRLEPFQNRQTLPLRLLRLDGVSRGESGFG